MKKTLEELVVIKAVQWWNDHRPVSWTREKHLSTPRINTLSDSEAQLANAVAKFIKAKKAVSKDAR